MIYVCNSLIDQYDVRKAKIILYVKQLLDV